MWPLVLLLVLSTLAPGLAAKERKGARVAVKKLDMQVISGELLSVTAESLTIRDLKTKAEITEDFQNIKVIEFLGMPKTVKGLVIGALAGVILGALVSLDKGQPDSISPAARISLLGIMGASDGALIGFLGEEQDIDFKSRDPEYMTKVVVRLRKAARNQGPN
jgi:hypothetical protein